MTLMNGKNIRELEGVDIALSKMPLSYALSHKDKIDANWCEEIQQNPMLFNGPFYFASKVFIEQNCLKGLFHRTEYKTLLYWRKDKRQNKPWHIFSSAVIVSADNGFVVGEMAAHTANAGAIYFPAGSIDDDDIINGKVDFIGNMRREVREETGLDLDCFKEDNRFYMTSYNRTISLFRLYRSSLQGKDIQQQIQAVLATQEKRELQDVSLIYNADDLSRSSRYIQDFVTWYQQANA